MRLVFDIETNGLLPDLHTVHCLCAVNADTGEEYQYVNTKYRADSDGSIEDGLALLAAADVLIGHNIVNFDLPALLAVYGWEPSTGTELFDTYVASMVAFPDMRNRDTLVNAGLRRAGKPPATTGYLVGSHTLKSWGMRLGVHKGDYGDNRTDWSVFDTAMLRYCMQDVRVNLAIYNRQLEEKIDPDLLRTEQKFAEIMRLQETHGFAFDVPAAEALVAKLNIERAKLHGDLYELFPPREVSYLTPKKKLLRTKTILFNPGSRDQIAWNLTNKYGWEPEEFTKTGKPRIDDAILEALPYPEAQMLARSLMIDKRLGAVSEGRGAYLNLVGKDGALHGRVTNVGTPHGRCSHTRPNMAQVASPKKEYGADVRKCFVARPGRVIVGCDASGIQLRALAHYLSRYDDGAFVEAVTTGDPHSVNQAAAGLETRDQAKTFIYAFLFGAGDEKIGSITGGGREDGKKTKARFYRRMPAVKQLVSDVTERLKANGGTLRGIDGRRVPCGALHVGLNYLLTSFEVAVMKLATVILHTELAPEAGLKFGTDYTNVAHVHDEYQFECVPEKAETLGKAARAAIVAAGERLGSRCPLDGDYKIGNSWYATH